MPYFHSYYNKNNINQNNLFKLNLFMFCSFITIYTFCNLFPKPFLFEKENINKEDSLLMQTEAIINGQIHLIEEPSKELIEMENPYDYYYRELYKIDYLYDTAYGRKCPLQVLYICAKVCYIGAQMVI